MKKELAANSLLYLICIVVACLLNLAVMWMAVKITDLFIAMDYFSLAVVKTVTSFITVPLVTGAVVFYTSYKSADFHPGMTALSLVVAETVHLLLSVILGFYPFIASGSRYLAGIMTYGTKFTEDTLIPDITLWTFIAAFLIYAVFNIAVCMAAGFIGKSRRIRQRKELTGDGNV